jgi:hypothetical protein
MNTEIVLNNMGFMELTHEEMTAVDGGSVFTDACGAITSAAIGLIVGGAVSVVATPAVGWFAATATATFVMTEWMKVFP